MTLRFFIFLFVPFCALAQQDSISLDEVVVSDRTLKIMSKLSSTMTFWDSVVRRDGASLTNLLRNSPLYFKENGYGMVASPAFRGTTAQQTAVIWNGINVNSQLNGLTDFNAAGSREFDIVTVRGGASGAEYGTSAIGGTIHLQNSVRFNEKPSTVIRSEYGSFNTSGVSFHAKGSTDRVAFSISGSNAYSKNDYELPSGQKNLNGEYSVTGLAAAASWKAGTGTLTYFGYSNFSDKRFSLLFPTDPRTRYRATALRNMLEWSANFKWFRPTARMAHISEEYNFFENASSDDRLFGKVNSIVARLENNIGIGNGITLNIAAENNSASARGTDIGDRNRNIFAASALLKHIVSRRLVYNLSLRQEIASDYKSPLLFGAYARTNITGDHYLRGSFAKSFRAPTFNDLYWGQGGNPGLKPETSIQAEAGYHYDSTGADIQVTAFYNKIRDMIHWNPATGGQWNPQNEDRVDAYGLEITGYAKAGISHHHLRASAHYSYTVSQNEDGNQLIYVPLHKGGIAFEWRYGKFLADVNYMLIGLVHTRSDNNQRYALDGYAASDFGLSRYFGRALAGFRIRNLFDAQYQVVERRYFPGRHYMIELTLKP